MSILKDKCVGCILTVMVGDVLGACVEGWTQNEIVKSYPEGVTTFQKATHMGIYDLPPRYGMYTDDTNSTLALANSLVEKQFIDPKDIALSYSNFYDHKPKRGYPDSAIAVLKSIKNSNGESYTETATLVFPNGSFANGGAMRISPIGIVFRNASNDVLYDACKLAIMSSIPIRRLLRVRS
jgi:ADP-ribosylglycohydrolase